jgi:hypothetical protein
MKTFKNEISHYEYVVARDITRALADKIKEDAKAVDLSRTPFERFFEGHLGEIACYKRFEVDFEKWVELKNKEAELRLYGKRDTGWDLYYDDKYWQIKTTRYKDGKLIVEKNTIPKKCDKIILVLGTGNQYLWNIYGQLDFDTFLERKYLSDLGSGLKPGWTVDKRYFNSIEEYIPSKKNEQMEVVNTFF